MLSAFFGLVLSHLLFFVLHVTGSGSFPRPLEARSQLIEHNLRLVAHVIKKYYSNINDQDDLVSIGTIGLIKAINTFDSSKGIRLSSYAARCIEKPIPS